MAKVIVVDDELGYRVSLEFFLRRAGHEVVAVGTPKLAIEQAEGFRPEVLVVDWLLGEKKTGADLVSELRTRLPHLQVVVMSGLGTQIVRGQAEALRIFCMVDKPFEPNTLLEAVNAAVAGLASATGPIRA
ncbi:MAG TPA: response regulator [Pirellulales bacterium]|nr:response regulator [Pirellulales bacterium]